MAFVFALAFRNVDATRCRLVVEIEDRVVLSSVSQGPHSGHHFVGDYLTPF